MKRFSKALFGLALAASSVLTACGGGPHGIVPSTTAKTTHSTGTIKASVHIPAAKAQNSRAVAYAKSQIASHSNGKRKPDFLNGATTEMDFTLETNNGSPVSSSDQAAFDFTIYLQDSSECTPDGNGGYNCTVSYPAPVGTDTYNVSAYECSVSGSNSTNSCQSLGGTLTLLSGSYTSVNVNYNQTTVAAFTLSPVVASIDWAPVTYATEAGSGAMASKLWLTQPNGSNIPKYTPSTTTYTCTYNAGSGTGNGCYEPVAKGYAIAYGEVLEVRDPTGALIIGASNNGTVYQTPVYLDKSGNAVTINWHCTDNAGGSSLTWETGNGPYTSNASATAANNNFNSPVANPAADPDGGNTTDGNGNPVTAVGNNGAEMNWDGVDQPVLDKPDSCTASTTNGLTTSTLDFYAGLGEGGLAPAPSPTPSATPTPSNFSEYPIPTSTSQPYGIVTGSDGALWFSESNGIKIGRITTSGVMTEYALPSMLTYGRPNHITSGPDGALWFSNCCTINNGMELNWIGRMTTSGTVTEYPLAANESPMGITSGPDGALWIADPVGDDIIRMTTSGSISAQYPLVNTANPFGIVSGPDGALWFTEQQGNKIGRITTSGSLTEYPIPTAGSAPSEIAVGSDGALWFSENNTEKIGRITTSGAITEYSIPAPYNTDEPWGMTKGSDGAVWFTLRSAVSTAALGRIDTSGNITEYAIPTSASDPMGITSGPDGALWFTEDQGNNIGRFMP